MAKFDWRGTNLDKRSCCASGPLLHGADVKDLQMTRRLAQLKFPFSIPETVEFYRVHYGATLKAFAGLSETARPRSATTWKTSTSSTTTLVTAQPASPPNTSKSSERELKWAASALNEAATIVTGDWAPFSHRQGDTHFRFGS